MNKEKKRAMSHWKGMLIPWNHTKVEIETLLRTKEI
jgi:hypothetical protein